MRGSMDLWNCDYCVKILHSLKSTTLLLPSFLPSLIPFPTSPPLSSSDTQLLGSHVCTAMPSLPHPRHTPFSSLLEVELLSCLPWVLKSITGDITSVTCLAGMTVHVLHRPSLLLPVSHGLQSAGGLDLGDFRH